MLPVVLLLTAVEWEFGKGKMWRTDPIWTRKNFTAFFEVYVDLGLRFGSQLTGYQSVQSEEAPDAVYTFVNTHTYIHTARPRKKNCTL